MQRVSSLDRLRSARSYLAGFAVEQLERRTFLSYSPGTPDTTFDQTGLNALSIPNTVYGNFEQVQQLSNGKILALGNITRSNTMTGSDVLLAQFNADGTLDTTFGGGLGYSITDINSVNQGGASFVVQPDGKIVVVAENGFLTDLNSSWIMRFKSNGKLDTSFGGDGTGYIASPATLISLSLLSNGDILAAGSENDLSTGIVDAVVQRYTSSGTLDSTFGKGGTTATELGTNPQTDDAFIYTMVQNASGQILLGGTIGDFADGYDGTDGLVIGYTASGKLDTTFGAGKGFTTAGTSEPDFFSTLNLLPDGDLELSGLTQAHTSSNDVVIATFTGAGVPIGLLTPAVLSGTLSDPDTSDMNFSNETTVQPNGQTVGVAEDNDFDDGDNVSDLYLLNPDGTLDSAFGDAGKFDTYANQNLILFGVSLDADSSILGAGLSDVNGVYLPAIARYYGLTNPAPMVTNNPISTTAKAGANVTLTSAATGTPTPTIQWKLSTNGGLTFKSIKGATSPKLQLTDVTASESGYEYEAVFTNSAGTATTTPATLTVTTPPTVTKDPKSQSVKSGANVKFTAAASGSPTPTVQWYVKLTGSKSFTPIAGATSLTFVLDDVTASDDGSYEAIFTNVDGTATTTTATLTVNG